MARLALLLIVIAGAAAPAAQSATLEVSDGVAVYTGEAGEDNDLSVQDGPSAQTFVIYDYGGDVLVPGAGCVPLGPEPQGAAFGFVAMTFVCTGADAARVDAGDGADWVDL